MTAPIDWNDDNQEQRDPATTGWRAALGRFTSAELRKTQAALAASQADLTVALREVARLEDNEHRWAGEVEYAERERDQAGKELELLRPVADAARAYVDSPEPPPLAAEEVEVRTWGDEMERRYLALLDAVTRAGAA